MVILKATSLFDRQLMNIYMTCRITLFIWLFLKNDHEIIRALIFHPYLLLHVPLVIRLQPKITIDSIF
jgi:hypothetical protein